LKPTQTRKSVVIIAAIAVAAIIAAAAITVGAGGYFTSGATVGSGIGNNQEANAATVAGTSSLAPANRTFWIDTVHLDGTTNIHGDGKHPPEAFPVNATYPKGGGFVLTPPDKNGTWNFRSFTFSTSQIVVYQGDRVTLNFVGVQGPSHMIEVEGIATFPLTRGEIHSVTFTADKAGTISYTCHVHMPNMRGEILVLPRPTGSSAT
jgi:hypothetical protein